MADTKWIAFFSQTGSEIADIADSIKRWPDVIITNDRPEHLRTVDERIAKQGYFTWSNKPTEDEYIELLEAYPDALVTLHGWLRIVPEYVCERSRIYNGHPGLIGCVLHKVTAGVDEGKVIAEERVNAFGLDLENTFRILRDRSLYLWVNFLKKVL